MIDTIGKDMGCLQYRDACLILDLTIGCVRLVRDPKSFAEAVDVLETVPVQPWT